ncbi:serine protease [Sporolactobacillus sp. THM7-7]|nr:serine protease [Sporolactobacillus sp. THM7-7]
MRRTNVIIFFMAVVVFAGVFLLSLVSWPSEEPNRNADHEMSAGQDGATPGFDVPKNGIHNYMGQSESQIRQTFGKPERIDETKYDYRWFVYGRGTENYVQIGIDRKSGKVSTIYALGKNLKTGPFVIGQASQRTYQKVPILDNVSFQYNGTKIEFELNEEDLMIRPLVKFGDLWVQLNFDHIGDRLVGVRYMSPAVLALQHPYSMVYEGKLPEEAVSTGEEWTAINRGEDREILDISNVLRMRFKKEALDWDESAHRAAYKHSREMQTRNYFSHDSRWSGDLRARLERESIVFQAAGENIAARYPDAIAVTIGWLNSADHRKNLLSDAYTALGVGSYKNYYTQDFVKPLNP